MAKPPHLLDAHVLLPSGLGLLVYVLVLQAGSKVLSDPDVYLHIAVGHWIMAHGAVPHQDVFSFSMPGAPWVPHEWLSEVIFAFVYDHIGWAGLVILTAFVFALAFVLLARDLLEFLTPAYALIGTVTAWLMSIPNLLARPHMLVFPLLVAWIAALVRARSRDRAPPFAYALLVLVWANLHGSFVLALAIGALFGAEALVMCRDLPSARRVIFGWGAFGLLSLAAAAVTPNGVPGLLLPFEVTSMGFTLSWIIEWKAPDFQTFPPLEPWLLLLLAGALSLGVRLPATRVLMLLLFVHMALQHRRHGAILGIATPLLIAPYLQSQLPRRLDRFIPSFFAREEFRQAWPSAIATVVALIFLYAVGLTVWRRDLVHDVAQITPSAALAAVKQNGITGRVFNDYNFGGYLIFSGVPTFIDGRADLYGDQFVRQFARRDDLPALLDQYKINWTLLGAENQSNQLLDHLPGWRRLYGDSVAVVHVREKPLPP